MEKTVFLTASYAVCLQLGFVSLLRILAPVAFSHGFLCINLSHRLDWLGFLWKMLCWDGPCHQCSTTSTKFCSMCGLYCVCSKISSENKTFQQGFLASLWPNSERESEEPQKAKSRTRLIWIMAVILRCFYRWLQLLGIFLQLSSSSNCVKCQLTLGIQPQLSWTYLMSDKNQGGWPDLFPLWLNTCSLCCSAITFILRYQV